MRNTKLSVMEKIGFGMGDAGNNMTFAAVVMYLSYFYTDVYGISPAIVGTIFISMRFVDAITDPLMGALADRTRSRWGRFRPYILFVPVPLAASCVLMFTTPDWSESAKIGYAFATYFAMSLLYTAVNIPYCALGGVITDDHRERVSFQSWRFILVGVAYLILNSSLMPLVELLGGGDETQGFQYTMAIMSVIALAMFGFCFATVRERVHPPLQKQEKLTATLKSLAMNIKWRIILGVTFLQALQFFLRQGAAIYFATYVLGFGTVGISVFITAGALASIAGTALSPRLSQRISKRIVFQASTLALIGTSCLLFFVPGQWGIVATVLFVLVSFMHGIGAPISWALMADAEDYGEWKTGQRNTGVSFAGNLFFLKMGLAVSGGMIGFLLSWGGYQANVDQQSDTALLVITLLLTLIPALVSLLMFWATYLFGLNDDDMDQVRGALQTRRPEQDSSPSSPDAPSADADDPAYT
ncbi:MFS transporter [Chromohalobacter sp. HP20-39]|uniref:MFS transporter n=1 Tax=Chromohalobacter sp. HP20-39 TaxID=3079306 RepID=UPI00294AFADE|nr:MFS transporter [Chromohalobacter sp. HP20-39]MDV6318526.1 MFS transporter [Chromohalobacter sp. HP20-39]